MNVQIAHDFLCPWCWIAIKQVEELQAEFPEITFEWLAYELMPEALDWPSYAMGATTEENPNKPKTPSRLELAYAAAGMTKPTAERPKKMRTHNALEAVEYAKTVGKGNELNDALYRAYWEEGKEINSLQVIADVAQGIIEDIDELLTAVGERKFNDKVIGFDDDAYDAGVYNVPTFFIDGERYAEQPTIVLRQAIQKAQTLAAR